MFCRKKNRDESAEQGEKKGHGWMWMKLGMLISIVGSGIYFWKKWKKPPAAV